MTTQFATFAAADGTPIEYADFGSGPVVFNIHPFGGSAEAQLPLLEQLADRFRCITFSQRGFGATPLQGEISLAQSARDAKELLEHLGVTDACFVALSMGAAVVWAYVDQFGCEYMNRAVIIDMTPMLVNRDGFRFGLYQGWYTPERYEADLVQQEADYVSFNKYFCEQAFLPHTPDEVRTFEFDERTLPVFEQALRDSGAPEGTPVEALFAPDPALVPTLRAYWRAMGEADLRPALGKFTVPALLIYARPGSIYSDATGEFVRDATPGARLQVGTTPRTSRLCSKNCRCSFGRSPHSPRNDHLPRITQDAGQFTR